VFGEAEEDEDLCVDFDDVFAPGVAEVCAGEGESEVYKGLMGLGKSDRFLSCNRYL
jgi:hypothetical protein